MLHRLLILCLTTAAAQAADPAGFRPLFNGRDLSEFVVDTPGLWRVENGVIRGVSPGLSYNDFLRTRKHYRDFTLRVRFKMIDPSGQANSGIQFRSKPMPDSHEVIGYQADIGQQYWGCLYDESRRRKILAQASPESLQLVRKNDWNDYVITARGKHVILELNGVKAVDWVETDLAVEDTGFIAFQLHSGPAFEMQFKDIEIREWR